MFVKQSRISARAILFDWDGTLLDSFRADARAYQSMFRALEIPWTARDLARHYSPDWYRVYEAARIPRDKWELADRLWGRAYQKENLRLLPGVRKMLARLQRDFVLGLVTSGDAKRVRRQLRHFEFTGLFRTCICAEDALRRKPHPAPLKYAMRCIKMRAQDCIYVGDAPEDIEMARRAGVRSIGVIGPFPSARRIRAARPDMLLTSILDLPGVITPDVRMSNVDARE
ncbi:MAG TPA: HAD family hydrolase [Candidatus Acidoferrales bacterium]|nr:HAD family hydrolase [Candidatus Acidoferrales bacterium]